MVCLSCQPCSGKKRTPDENTPESRLSGHLPGHFLLPAPCFIQRFFGAAEKKNTQFAVSRKIGESLMQEGETQKPHLVAAACLRCGQMVQLVCAETVAGESDLLRSWQLHERN
jgi:hypothetical protein